jgi:hypothetical protein
LPATFIRIAATVKACFANHLHSVIVNMLYVFSSYVTAPGALGRRVNG